MEDLFRSYWWLLFPMAWFFFGGFSSFLNYRRQKDTLNLLRTYAEKGQEPPAALLKVLERPIDEDDGMWGGTTPPTRSNDGNWFSVVLFGAMAAGFGYASYTDMYGAGDAFLIVTFVLGALCLACLVSALANRRRAKPRA
jgi:hypothetical protein